MSRVITKDAFNRGIRFNELGYDDPTLNEYQFEIVNDWRVEDMPFMRTLSTKDEDFEGFNFLIESDEDTIDNQLKTAFTLFKDPKNGIARITYSGCKSIHVIVHCSENILDSDERKFIFDKIRTTLFNGCTCDIQNKNRARKTRRPGAHRELSDLQSQKVMNMYDENPLFAKLCDIDIIKTYNINGRCYITQSLLKEDWTHTLDVSEWRREYQFVKKLKDVRQISKNLRYKNCKKGDWHNLPAVKLVLCTKTGSRDADLNRACYSMRNNGYESEISVLIDEVEGIVGCEIAQKFRRQYVK